MTDNRTLQEIIQAHPVPWVHRTHPLIINGQTRIMVLDKAGVEVPLFTMLRIVQLVTDKIATQGVPA